MRAKGVWTYKSPPNPAVAEAEAKQRQHQEELAERRQKAYDNAPNSVCYADAYEEWKAKGRGKLPKCNRCRATLHWGERHNCPGYIPRYRENPLTHEERVGRMKASWDDWDDDQFDPTTPEGADWMRHEAETGETRDQVVIEGMTEDEYLMRKFGYIPRFEDFEE